MTKDMNYYRQLDLRAAACGIPKGTEKRQTNELFQDLLKAIIVRHGTEPITEQDLLTWLGKPDSRKQAETGEAWEYKWRGEHMGREYRGSDIFLVADGKVVAVERQR